MRFTLIPALLLLLGLPSAALAQTLTAPGITAPALALHKPPATAPAAAPPAKSGPAILPGSPLAALTAVAAAVPAPAPAPFGTDSLGFAAAKTIGEDAAESFARFTRVVRASTSLAPITEWLDHLLHDKQAQADARTVAAGLLLALLPAALVDAGMRLGLRRPVALCARWAQPRHTEFLPEAGTEPVPSPRAVSLRAWARRFGFALLKFLLCLLPVAGFAVTAQVFLSSGLITARPALLAATGIGNAYMAARAAQELARLLISPTAPSLRLTALSTPRAAWLMHGVLILLATLFMAYVATSSAVILGLSRAGTDVTIRLFALAVNVEIAVAIWQARRVVGRWISGSPTATGHVAVLRHRFGAVWHFIALFYVLALWLAYAGGVENAFFVLLRAVLVLAAGLVGGRLAWAGSAALLDRLLEHQPQAPGAAAHPALRARAHAYYPLLRAGLRVLVAVLALLLILQGWGLNALGWLLTDTLSRALLTALSTIIITIAVALVLWEVTNFALHSRIERLTSAGRTRQAARLRTLAPMLRAAIGTIIFLVALFTGLARIGVNTTGLLAISSVAGIAVGFGSQKLVQDIITGLFLLLEDAMQVGDVVTLAGMTGTVERLSIRTIRLRGGDGSVNIIPFSAVTTVTNMTRDFGFAEIAINVGLTENLDHVCAVLTDISKTMRAEPAWRDLMRDEIKIFGLDKIGDSSLNITGQIRTAPGQQAPVRREFYLRVQKRFGEEGIPLPGSQPPIYRLQLPPDSTIAHDK